MTPHEAPLDAPLDDGTLTEDGLPLTTPPSPSTTPSSSTAPAPGRLLVIGCGALAHELTALIRANGWNHVTLTCLPAIWHNTPERIAPGVADLVRRHRDEYDRILVAYADCGTGGQLRAICDDLGVGMIEGPHCYAFFSGIEAFAARAGDEVTAFYLTDFLARQFDAFVVRPLGLDRHPELREAYFGNYDRLIYLAQSDDADLDARARAAAQLLGLRYERRFTGYGDLARALENAVGQDAGQADASQPSSSEDT